MPWCGQRQEMSSERISRALCSASCLSHAGFVRERESTEACINHTDDLQTKSMIPATLKSAGYTTCVMFPQTRISTLILTGLQAKRLSSNA